MEKVLHVIEMEARLKAIRREMSDLHGRRAATDRDLFRWFDQLEHVSELLSAAYKDVAA